MISAFNLHLAYHQMFTILLWNQAAKTFAYCYIFAIPKAGSEVVISKAKISQSSDVSNHFVFVKSSIGRAQIKTQPETPGFGCT